MAKRRRDVCTCRKANRSGKPDAASSSVTCRGRKKSCASSRRLSLRTGPSSPSAASRTRCRSATWAWMADTTYIETQAGWLYLATILDLYSRKIVGWAMSERIDTALVLKTLGMALLHRNPPRDLLFHSDRGVQYASGDYRRTLAQAGLIASMSRKGNCYDNAT